MCVGWLAALQVGFVLFQQGNLDKPLKKLQDIAAADESKEVGSRDWALAFPRLGSLSHACSHMFGHCVVAAG